MKSSVRKIIQADFIGTPDILIVLILIYWELVSYGLQQGYGQLNIIWNAKPVEEYSKGSNFSRLS